MVVFVERNREAAEREPIADRHLVLRTFVVIARLSRTHQKFAARQRKHLRTPRLVNVAKDGEVGELVLTNLAPIGGRLLLLSFSLQRLSLRRFLDEVFEKTFFASLPLLRFRPLLRLFGRTVTLLLQVSDRALDLARHIV
jgi:hypothetical protein